MKNKNISLKNTFYVQSIDKHLTYEWLLYKHYAKCIPNIMYSFGLYDINNILQAICCYGTPANNHNNNLGDFKMIELVRLVSNENLPTNTLSFFLAKTFKLLPDNLSLISYADKGKNHSGYIYQATNWIYTGLGGGVDFYINQDNKEIHSRIMSDYRKKFPNETRAEIADKLKWKKVKGTYKHRYFNFIGNKRNKKKWLDQLKDKYKIKEYPKNKNINYDASYKTLNQTKLF
tara:strand:+ start:77 stop:772 length:696 start_codon:yes stop_codon:yes gene_type:complete